jgi:hypothetical protein
MACCSQNHSQEAAQVNLKPSDSARTVPAYPPPPLHRGRRQVTGGEYCLCWLRERQGRPGSALGLWSAHVPWRVTAPQAGAGHSRAAARVYNPLVEAGKHKRKYVIRKKERSGEIPGQRNAGVFRWGLRKRHRKEDPNHFVLWPENPKAKPWERRLALTNRTTLATKVGGQRNKEERSG